MTKPAISTEHQVRDALYSLTFELQDAVAHYEKSAPTVAEYLNGLFIRMGKPDEVRTSELLMAASLRDCNGEWLGANYAANTVYKLMQRLGMSTTGHAGF